MKDYPSGKYRCRAGKLSGLITSLFYFFAQIVHGKIGKTKYLF